MRNKHGERKSDDKDVIDLLKKDRKNFARVYKEYYAKIANYFKKRISDKSLAEDFASEVFEKAMKAMDDFKWQGVSISVWLFKIARNLLTDYYRRIGRYGHDVSLTEIEDLFEDDETEIDIKLEEEEDVFVLFDALREFREVDQYLLYYKFFEDLSNKEIAQITGFAESNVGTRLYRIRKKLKKILEK